MSSVNGVGSAAGAIFVPQNPTDPVTVANALAILRVKPSSTVVIADTVQNISANLEALQKVAAKVTSLSTTDATQKLTINATQYSKDSAILAKWGAGSGNTVEVTAVKASAAKALVNAKPSWVTSVVVNDSSANIQKKLDDLQTLASSGDLRQIVQTGAVAPLKITAAQFAADTDALSVIKNGGYTLAITDASVSDTLGLGANPALTANGKIKTIDVKDTTDAIETNLDALQHAGLRIKSLSQTDATTTLTVTGDQYRNDSAALGKILTSYHLAVIRASAVQSSLLSTNNKVLTVSVADTAANISKKWNLLQNLTAGLTAVEVTDSANAVAITGDQLAQSETLLGKFTDDATHTYKLAVNGVSAGTAAAVADVDHVDSINVSDTAANIAANLDDLEAVNDVGLLGGVTFQGKGSVITLDSARLQGAAGTATQGVLNKISTGAYSLAVTGVSLTDLNALASNTRVVSMEVGGSSDQIESNLDSLYTLGKRVANIAQSDSGTALDVTQSTLESRSAVLAKITGGYTVNVTGVTAAKAVTDAANNHVVSIGVADNGKNLVANWDALRSIGDTLNTVTKTDAGSLSVSADQYAAGVNDALTGKFDASLKFSVFGASVGQATTFGSDTAVDKIDVTDDGSSITGALSDLDTLRTGGKLNSIALTNPSTSLALHASQLDGAQDVLDLIVGGKYTLAVDQAAAADARDLAQSNAKISTLKVSDDASSIVDNLSDLTAIGHRLVSIAQSDAGTNNLALTGSVFEQNRGTLDKIAGGYRADLSAVGASKAATLAGNASVNSVQVSDDASHLSAAWDTLATVGAKLTDVAQTDSNALQLTARQWISAHSLGDKFSTTLAVDVSAAGVSDLATLGSDDAVQTIQVKDNANALSDGLADLAAEAKLTQIQVADPTTALTMSADTYGNSSDVLGKISGSYKVALSDVAIADAATLDTDTHVSALDVTGTSTDITTNFSDLAALTHLHGLALSDDGGTLTLSSAQILGNASTLGKITSSFEIAATGVAMADLADIKDVNQIASIAVSDTAQNVSDNFGDLLELGGSLSTLHLTDATPVLALSQEDWTSGAASLAKIDSSYQVDLSEVAAADATTIATDATIHQISVADTSDDIASNWSDLISAFNNGTGKLAAISLTDNNPLTLTEQQQTDGAAMITALLPDESIVTAA